jgi:hypothetical protein
MDPRTLLALFQEIDSTYQRWAAASSESTQECDHRLRLAGPRILRRLRAHTASPANTRSAAHGNPAGPRRLIQRYRASRGPVTDLAAAAFALTDGRNCIG